MGDLLYVIAIILIIGCLQGDQATVDRHLVVHQDRRKGVKLYGKLSVVEYVCFYFEVGKELLVAFVEYRFHLDQPVELTGVPRHFRQRVNQAVEFRRLVEKGIVGLPWIGNGFSTLRLIERRDFLKYLIQ